MFDRFTDGARKCMGLAHTAAVRFAHDWIGTEHVLLGILEWDEGVPARVFEKLGVDPKEIRREVEERLSLGTTTGVDGSIPFTPRTKRVLFLSFEESSNLGHAYIGPEHLLLGLIREEEGIAGEALAALGIRLEPMRAAIVELVTFEPPAAAEDAQAKANAREESLRRTLFEDPVQIALARGGEHAHDRGSGMTTDDLWVGLLMAALQRGPEADLGIPRADLDILLGQAVFVATRRLTSHWPAEDAERLDPDLMALLKRAVAFARDRGASVAGPKDVLAALVADEASGTCETLRSVALDPAAFRRPHAD